MSKNKIKNQEVKTRVVHSLSKPAWNIIGVSLGGKHKMARVPYIESCDNSKMEALEDANFISDCFNNSGKIKHLLEQNDRNPNIILDSLEHYDIVLENGVKCAIDELKCTICHGEVNILSCETSSVKAIPIINGIQIGKEHVRYPGMIKTQCKKCGSYTNFVIVDIIRKNQH